MKIDKNAVVAKMYNICKNNLYVKTDSFASFASLCANCEFRGKRFCRSYMSLNILEENPELVSDLSKNIPQIEKIEVGTLMSPSEIKNDKEVNSLTYLFNNKTITFDHTHYLIGCELYINEHSFPKNWYKDIKYKFNFNKIIPNSVVEIKTNTETYYGKFSSISSNYDIVSFVNGNNIKEIYTKNIKNVTILKLPK